MKILDLLQYVQEKKNKYEYTLPRGILQPLSFLDQKWEIISMDFITGLPKVHEKDCIFFVVGHLTRYAHFFSIPTGYQASQVVDVTGPKNVKLKI